MKTNVRSIASGITFGVSLAALVAGGADPLSAWHRRDPAPDALLGVAFGRGVFIAVGDNGAILRSTNALDWVQATSPVRSPLRSVTCSEELFVAVGDGVVLTSPDGEQWEQERLESGLRLLSVVRGARGFIAVGPGVIVTSADGHGWSTRRLDPYEYEGLVQIVHGNGKYIALVYNPFGPFALVSADGETWTSEYRNCGCGPSGFAFVNDRWLRSCGGIQISSDAARWDSEHYDSDFRVKSAAFGNGIYVAVGFGTVYSSDGLQWHGVSYYGSPNSVCFGNGAFVSVGDYGQIMASVDGAHWTEPLWPRQSLLGLAYGNGVFVASGAMGRLLVSTNGAQWDWRLTEVRQEHYGVGYGNGLFVVVGSAGQILSSSNVLQWTAADAPVPGALSKVAFGAGTFVAVGGRYSGFEQFCTIATSSNAVDWVSRDAPSKDYLYDVAFSGREFCAVGRGGDILLSPNGIDWLNRTPASHGPLAAIAHGNGRWIAVGGFDRGGEILGSPDGVHWETHLRVGVRLNDVTFARGAFLALDDLGNILVSEDGLGWVSYPSDCGCPLFQVAVGEGLGRNSGFCWGARSVGSTVRGVPLRAEGRRHNAACVWKRPLPRRGTGEIGGPPELDQRILLGRGGFQVLLSR